MAPRNVLHQSISNDHLDSYYFKCFFFFSNSITIEVVHLKTILNVQLDLTSVSISVSCVQCSHILIIFRLLISHSDHSYVVH